MSLTKENLKCKICKQFYVDPIILPCCNCTICKAHMSTFIIESRPTFIKCSFCTQEFEIPKTGFRSNQYAHELIAMNTHLNDLTKDIQLELDISLIELNYLHDELEKKMPEVENFIPSYLAEIRVRIELQRKNLKLKIDHMADKCVRKSREYEAKCMQKLDELKETVASFKHKDILIDLNKNMKNLFSIKEEVSSLDEINKFKKEINTKIGHLEKLMSDLKYLNFKVENSDFEPLEKDATFFGKLNLVNDYQLISCADDKLIKIRNLNEQQIEPRVIKGHKNNVHCLILTDDGHLISGGSDKVRNIEIFFNFPNSIGQVFKMCGKLSLIHVT
jgi:hypothetical protein